MKQITSIILGSSIFLMSCGGNKSDQDANDLKVSTSAAVPIEDTVGLAAYKAQKAQAQTDSIQSLKDSIAKIQEVKTAETPATKTVIVQTAAAPVRSHTSQTNARSAYQNGYNQGYATASTTKKKKKGISNGAKGAIVGGLGGAAVGALVTKHNRGIGAAVGAAAGAGAGYLVGKSTDKK